MKRIAVTLLCLAPPWVSGCLPQVGPAVDGGAGGGAASGGGAGGGGAAAGGGGGAPASCTDSTLDSDETDVDCGGSCPPCALNLACLGPADCQTGVCAAAHCAMPANPCGTFAGCVTFTDLTAAAADRTITFGGGSNTYVPKCVRVKLGQQVTFSGSFSSHPLRQSCGPVNGVLQGASGSSASFTLDQALGVFGYYCDQHGSPNGSGMAGAIEVVR